MDKKTLTYNQQTLTLIQVKVSYHLIKKSVSWNHSYERQALQKIEAEKQKEKDALNSKIDQFRKRVQESDDLNDRL